MPAGDLRDLRRLFGRSLRGRKYGNSYAVFLVGAEFHFTFNESKERVVFTHADIDAGVPFGAALADNDIAGEDLLAAKTLHAEPATR
jgi:hypothetical protein